MPSASNLLHATQASLIRPCGLNEMEGVISQLGFSDNLVASDTASLDSSHAFLLS